MVNEYAYACVFCTKWYMRHKKPKTNNHRVKHMYQSCHVINFISKSQGKYLQCSCDYFGIFVIYFRHILVVYYGKVKVDMIHFTFWRRYIFLKEGNIMRGQQDILTS